MFETAPPTSILQQPFELKFSQPPKLPVYTGSMFRGALGHALHKLYCRCTSLHQHKDDCLFSLLFIGPKTEKWQATSPCFAFSPLSSKQGTDNILFGNIYLFGPAINYQKEFLQAFCLACADGLTENKLVAICHLLPLQAIGYRPLADSISIQLTTPLFIKRKINGSPQVVTPEIFSFNDFLVALHRRLNTLSLLYQTPQFSDLDNWFKFCKQLTYSYQLEYVSYSRFSSKQRKKIPIGGLMGTIDLSSNLSNELQVALQLGQCLHIGGKAALGLGAYQLSNLI
ncbi:CRISPR system precrRNA processing endoribonuclease RAMP protein Cas6 [Pseudomonas sp. F1_0610]|uniref:CRISPR system precrRNA processing endoribonuclease RAMP protein Cas6 n=1 Tax=Pseudomonas sp. F1_0610 TaxID=3114284 RepID=UPI0039C2E973